MRHSARFPIPHPDLTYEIGLTEEGVRTAEAFGSLLNDRFQPGRMLSTPVGRCIATGEAIARGAGWPVQVTSDERLSHPFMAPAWHEVESGRLNGILPWQIRATLGLLVGPLQKQPVNSPVLSIFVTHDTVLGAVVGGLLRAPVLGSDWPRFLEGVFLWWVDGQLHARWRGLETIFDEQLSRIE